MNSSIVKKHHSIFEEIRQVDENGMEYWSARQMSKVLEYSEYRHFLPVIEKAKEACKNSNQNIFDHFEDILEMVSIGSRAERQIDSIKLSRYACYLIVQNADPGKAVVANGQTYFAVQTRIAEIKQMEEYTCLSTEDEKRLFLRDELTRHNIQLADAAKNAGVIEPIDYAIFQNHGYKGLYGGLDAKAANLFRATQTEEKLRREKITGKTKANITHYKVGAKVRQTIEELGGTMPENLPVADSIKSVETKQRKQLSTVKSDDKK